MIFRGLLMVTILVLLLTAQHETEAAPQPKEFVQPQQTIKPTSFLNELGENINDGVEYFDDEYLEPLGDSMGIFLDKIGDGVGAVAGFSTEHGVEALARVADMTGHNSYANSLRRKKKRIVKKVTNNVARFTSKSVPSIVTTAIGVMTNNTILIGVGAVGIANAGAKTKLENMRSRNDLSQSEYEDAIRATSGMSFVATDLIQSKYRNKLSQSEFEDAIRVTSDVSLAAAVVGGVAAAEQIASSAGMLSASSSLSSSAVAAAAGVASA
jgi:hypothetical protein